MKAPAKKKSATSTAWALLVVSDSGQAETLPNQEAWAREAAAQNGWTITRTFSGVSTGKWGTRGLASQMINELEELPPESRPERVCMIRLERLGRGDGTDAIESFLRIRKLGVIVHTRLDGDVSYGKASELLMPVLRFFIGGMENEVRRDKLNATYARRREAHKTDPTVALSNRPPYGLQFIEGHLVEQLPEAQTVRQIFELKVQGYGAHLIAKRIAASAPPMVMKGGRALPMVWTADRVRKLILKTTYRGTLIDAETWERAQRHLREIRRKSRTYEYPLGGALRCECGYALIGQAGAGRGHGRWRNYMCVHYENHGGHSRSHLITKIDPQFVELLQRLAADDALLERYVSTQGEGPSRKSLSSKVSARRRELSGLENRRRKIFEAFESGSISKKDLEWRLTDLRNVEARLSSEITSLESQLGVNDARTHDIGRARDLIRNAAEHWLSAEIEDKRALSKAVSIACGGLFVTVDGKLVVGVRRGHETTASSSGKKGYGRVKPFPPLNS
jgi:DNA invertase Pin-like site-specific DNA recombinase